MKEIIQVISSLIDELKGFNQKNKGKSICTPSSSLIAFLSHVTSFYEKENFVTISGLILDVIRKKELVHNNELQEIMSSRKVFLLNFFQAFNNYEENAGPSNDSFLQFLALVQRGLKSIRNAVAKDWPFLLKLVKEDILTALTKMNNFLLYHQSLREHNLATPLISMRDNLKSIQKEYNSIIINENLHPKFDPGIQDSRIKLILSSMDKMVEHKTKPYFILYTSEADLKLSTKQDTDRIIIVTWSKLCSELMPIRRKINQYLSSNKDEFKATLDEFNTVIDNFESRCLGRQGIAEKNSAINRSLIKKVITFLRIFDVGLLPDKNKLCNSVFNSKNKQEILQLVEKLEEEIKYILYLSDHEFSFVSQNDHGSIIPSPFSQHFVTSLISDAVNKIRSLITDIYEQIKSLKHPLHNTFLKIVASYQQKQESNYQEDDVLEAIKMILQLPQEDIENEKSKSVTTSISNPMLSK